MTGQRKGGRLLLVAGICAGFSLLLLASIASRHPEPEHIGPVVYSPIDSLQLGMLGVAVVLGLIGLVLGIVGAIRRWTGDL